LLATLRKAADCERIIAEPLAHFGRLDILVNNDGAPPLGELMSFDDAAWDKAWQQNFMSVVRLTRGAIPAMRKAGGGRIVNITALSVLQPMPKFGLSVATWAAVIGYAKTLSLEVAADNITVNTICPGRFATGRLAKVFGGSPEEVAEMHAQVKRDVPLGRIGDVSEIAAVVAMLVSDGGSYITGTTMHVDGGRRANLL
jgi:3-oxoacyl-[acyl-carrier protein] reductase